jgi:hypothetical protein
MRFSGTLHLPWNWKRGALCQMLLFLLRPDRRSWMASIDHQGCISRRFLISSPLGDV